MSAHPKSTATPATSTAAKPVYYPDTDGKPMGESDLHRGVMFHIIHLLQRYFAGQQVYVTGNLLLYYKEGNPRKVIVPDCFVVWGVEAHLRPIYKLWEEAHGPKVVFEVTSKTTRRNDLGSKMRLYAQLGIEEYYLYDPTSEYLVPPLTGFRLAGNKFVPMELEQGESAAFVSPRLGLRLYLDEDCELQFVDIASGERLLSDEEARMQAEQARLAAEEACWQAEAGRQQAETLRMRAEQENARLREELARLRGDNQARTS